MRGLLKAFFRNENGVAATELALATPVFLLMFLSVTELGNLIYYATTIEKGMRSGVTYAARNQIPLTAEVVANAISLAKTGAMPAKNAPFLVKGYAEQSAKVVITTKVFQQNLTGQSEDIITTVVVLRVEVPYMPLIPGITAEILGGYTPVVQLQHEQTIIGD